MTEMWCFTRQGFYAAVQHNDDPDLIIVRTRTKEDMVATGWPYIETPDFDYGFRATISRDLWVSFVADAAADVDYPSFKSSLDDPDRYDVYFDVWLALLKLQPPGWGRYTPAGTIRAVKPAKKPVAP
jgi:hypothetical protein